jgi:hypothetical protein
VGSNNEICDPNAALRIFSTKFERTRYCCRSLARRRTIANRSSPWEANMVGLGTHGLLERGRMTE